MVAGKQLIAWCHCADHLTVRCQDVVQDLPHCSNDKVTELSVSTTSSAHVNVAEGTHCCSVAIEFSIHHCDTVVAGYCSRTVVHITTPSNYYI